MFISKDSMIEAEEARAFLDMVDEDECLRSWFDEHLSDAELLDRLKHMKANAPTRLRRDREDSFERVRGA